MRVCVFLCACGVVVCCVAIHMQIQFKEEGGVITLELLYTCCMLFCWQEDV